jgi:hypothetical protein
MGRVTRRVGYPHYCGVSAGSRQLFTHRVHLKAININLRLYTCICFPSSAYLGFTG